jgi:hypothetical protein
MSSIGTTSAFTVRTYLLQLSVASQPGARVRLGHVLISSGIFKSDPAFLKPSASSGCRLIQTGHTRIPLSGRCHFPFERVFSVLALDCPCPLRRIGLCSTGSIAVISRANVKQIMSWLSYFQISGSLANTNRVLLGRTGRLYFLRRVNPSYPLLTSAQRLWRHYKR